MHGEGVVGSEDGVKEMDTTSTTSSTIEEHARFKERQERFQKMLDY